MPDNDNATVERKTLHLIDLGRYPIDDLESERGRAMVAGFRRDLQVAGCCTIPGFLTPQVAATLAAEAEADALAPRAWAGIGEATPYYGKIDPDLPDDLPTDHPRLRTTPRVMVQVAYDLIPETSGLRRLYLSAGLPKFLAAVLGTERLHPMACRYQAVNISVMGAGGCQNWHFDSSNFTITLMLQKPETGGEFQCVPFLRDETDENYEGVARVLDGDRKGLLTIPLEAGTLMIFQGHRSLHRVSEVGGQVKRLLTIMHYDTRPGLIGKHEVNRKLYGPRVEPQVAGAAA